MRIEPSPDCSCSSLVWHIRHLLGSRDLMLLASVRSAVAPAIGKTAFVAVEVDLMPFAPRSHIRKEFYSHANRNDHQHRNATKVQISVIAIVPANG